MRPIIVTGNAAAGSTTAMVRMDEWALPQIAIQCNVTGTINYTVQSSLDDPNDPTNPVAVGSMTWINTSDSSGVSASGNIQTNFQFCPRFIRLLLNSGTGSVTATILQSGVAPY